MRLKKEKSLEKVFKLENAGSMGVGLQTTGCKFALEVLSEPCLSWFPLPQHFLQLEQISGRLSASLLHSHDTETRATMNLALAGNILAAGQDAHCQLLRFQIHQQKGKNKAEKAGESPPC